MVALARSLASDILIVIKRELVFCPRNPGASVTRKEVGYTAALHGNGVSRLLQADGVTWPDKAIDLPAAGEK